jgi:hypothetical protein
MSVGFAYLRRNLAMMRASCAALILLCGSIAAGADHCPQEIETFDKLLSGGSLDYATRDELMKYRDEAAELHKAGKHKEALEAIEKAKNFLEHVH